MVALTQLAHFTNEAAGAQSERCPGQAQKEVFGYGLARHKAIVLVDHPNAMFDGVFRRVKRDWLAVHVYLARIRPVETCQNAHQRGLARPVLAEQGVHFAPPRRELHPAVGHHAGKGLVDPHHRDGDIGHTMVGRITYGLG